MSKEIKMSDVFGLPLVVCIANPQMITAKPKVGYPSATIRSPDYDEITFAAHAINNHDRLVEENKRLRDFVKKVSEVDIETLNFETQDGDEDYIEYVDPEITEEAADLIEELDNGSNAL